MHNTFPEPQIPALAWLSFVGDGEIEALNQELGSGLGINHRDWIFFMVERGHSLIT